MYEFFNRDCLDWIAEQKENSITGVVTDPPYAFMEYTPIELKKKRSGKGGVWRIPPTFDGCERSPLPRFSVINDCENLRSQFVNFYEKWGKLIFNILAPGAHIIIAATPLLSDLLGAAMRSAGFERRGEIVRIVSTLRGGDRPKGAEEEFNNTSVIPRASWEPWGIYGKLLSEKTVAQNLRKWKAGALRRPAPETPFCDVLNIGGTSAAEKRLCGHPNQKPQSLMRKLTHAVLSTGEGTILDPFAGSGSTIAAAEFNGLLSIGIEMDKEFYEQALKAIPKLSKFGAEQLLII